MGGYPEMALFTWSGMVFGPIDLQWGTRSSDGITIGDHFLVDGGVS
jgi:hypothetical protein